MSTKISELSEQLGLSPKELKEKIIELGFEISPRARVLDDEIAELVIDELTEEDVSTPDKDDVADVYDSMIEQETEREVVRSQRKKTAGRGEKKHDTQKTQIVTDTKVSKTIEIGDHISVKEFAEKSGITAAKIIGELMKNGILANINQQIDFETCQVIAEDLAVKITRKRAAAGADEFLGGDISKLLQEDDSSDLEIRPPVVVVMGHVDHGKTKLLDSIREADVVSGESGGITQHIGAYQVEKNGKLITFLDTPGHEAFTAMRARGAKVTDIAVLVVASDEGIKPQTIEAINHAREAGVPILVALNKIDKPDANPDKVMAELAEQGLQPEEWGGDTIMVKLSALTGEGVDDLLEMILLTAEMATIKANPNREAVGTVIESNLDSSLGPVATVLVNTGTLRKMDNIIIGHTYGRIKLMRDHHGKSLKAAGPAAPVFIAGMHETPKSGDILQVVKNEKIAKDKANEVNLIEKEQRELRQTGLNLLISQVQADKVLKIVLKTDVKGSIEAIKQSLAKIKDDEVAVKVIHSGVGTVTESDIMMAAASRAFVMSFHSDFNTPNVKRSADRENVEVRKYTVIYDLIEDVKKILTGLLEPELIEIIIGRGNVKQVFYSKKRDMILGVGITSGKYQKGAMLRIIRKDEEVGKGVIKSLRKVNKEVKELKEGNDCGIKYHGDPIVQEGDEIEAYIEEEKTRVIS